MCNFDKMSGDESDVLYYGVVFEWWRVSVVESGLKRKSVTVVGFTTLNIGLFACLADHHEPTDCPFLTSRYVVCDLLAILLAIVAVGKVDELRFDLSRDSEVK